MSAVTSASAEYRASEPQHLFLSLLLFTLVTCSLCWPQRVDGRTPAPTAAEGIDRAAAQTLAGLQFRRAVKLSYHEQQMNPMLTSPREQSGELWIEQDGSMIMRVLDPRLEQRRLNGNLISLQRPTKRQLRLLEAADNPDAMHAAVASVLKDAKVRSLKLNPNHAGHLALLAVSQVLARDLDSLGQHFVVTKKSAKSGSWQVNLTPRAAKVRGKLQVIELRGQGTELASLTTARSNGSWSTITFIKPELEAVKPGPKHADVR